MASQVLVIDAQMKRAVVKVTPSTSLSDVLAEACGKLGHKPEQYGLKHNNKPVDLSRTIRLAGLSNNAKLELVQASRSPSVVSVALQFPASSGEGSTRLTDKFPSNTPIWQILRRFEAGVAGGVSKSSANHNFTQRATPQVADGAPSGSGRLCYEMPVVNVMNRNLASFGELQRTLGQLGFNGGTCLLRLSYKNTQQPLEEAMTEITKYFKELEDHKAGNSTENHGAHSGTASDMLSKPDVDGAIERDMGSGPNSPPIEDTDMLSSPTLGDHPMTSTEAGSGETIPQSSSRVPMEASSDDEPAAKSPRLEPPVSSLAKMEIYTPSTASTPMAANQPHNEDDYNISIVQAQQYQAHLNRASRNKRLASDKEIADQEQARVDALKAVKSITVALRLPDTSRVTQGYDRNATASDLYAKAREVLHRPKNEAFTLLSPGKRNLIKEDGRKLIADFGWTTSVLVTVEWVNPGEHEGPVLKEAYLNQAQELKVKPVDDAPVEADAAESTPGESSKDKKSTGKQIDKEERMKKLMNRMGFKK